MRREIEVETIVKIEVEQALSELSDEEIAKEYRDRELGYGHSLNDVKDALQRGDDKAALALIKTVVCDEYGIVL